jgi:hypothetical protein
MERAAGFVHDDTPHAKLDKLDAVLAQTSTSTHDAALFDEMLSLANDGRYPVLELTSEQRRQRTLEALLSQIEALTRRNPVLMGAASRGGRMPRTVARTGSSSVGIGKPASLWAFFGARPAAEGAAVTDAPSGGPWAKGANGRSSSRRSSNGVGAHRHVGRGFIHEPC